MKFWKNLFWKSIGSCEWRKLVGGTDGAPMAARWWATNRPKRPPSQLPFAKAKLDWQLDVSIMVARGWMSLAGIMWNLCRAELTGRIGCASVGCLAAVVDANWIGSWFLRRRSSARRWRGQLSNRFTWRCHPLCSHQPPVCASVSTKGLCVACQTPLNCVVRHQWKQCHFASTSFATDPLFIGHGRWHFECDAICTGRHRQPVAKLTWIEIEVSSGRWSSPHVGPPLKRNRNAIAIPLANPIPQSLTNQVVAGSTKRPLANGRQPTQSSLHIQCKSPPKWIITARHLKAASVAKKKNPCAATVIPWSRCWLWLPQQINVGSCRIDPIPRPLFQTQQHGQECGNPKPMAHNLHQLKTIWNMQQHPPRSHQQLENSNKTRTNYWERLQKNAKITILAIQVTWKTFLNCPQHFVKLT